MVSDIVLLYVTCADLDEARRIGRCLVEERLAACVNLRAHETIYRWQEAVEAGPEAALLVKTTQVAAAAAEARNRALHSYSLPGILRFAPSGGLPDFLRWIAESVGPAQ